MTAFEENLGLLRRVNPNLVPSIKLTKIPDGLEVKTSRTGLPVPRIEGISLHSTYDPVGEAKRLVEAEKSMINDQSPRTILVFGLGFGYHIEQLLRLCPQSRVVIIEPRRGVLRAAMEFVDLKEILQRCQLWVGEAPEQLWKEISKEAALCQIDQWRIFEHKPSVRLNRSYFKQIREKVNLERFLSERRLKILVVFPVQGGSLPIARYCAQALRNLGHQVEVLDNSIYQPVLDSIDQLTENEVHRGQLRGLFTAFLSEMAVAKSLAVGPDLILALAQAPLNPQALDRLHQFGFRTAFWFVEDFRQFDYWKKVAPHYDYFFTIQQGEFFRHLERIGVKNYRYLPLAASPQVHRKVRLKRAEREEFCCDVSFVGAGYYNRRNLFLGLLDFDFKIWGDGWGTDSALGGIIQRGGRRVSTQECVKIFCASKININLHSSAYHEGINPNGDFVNPRTFEIASCGAFQLVDFRSELPDLFEIGKEIITFGDLDDLRNKIKYYLKHPQEREKIALRARRRVLQDHTYESRMKQMLAFILEREQRTGKDSPLIRARQTSVTDSVEKLIRQAAEDAELKGFLSQFRDKDRICLKDMVQRIHKGKGELTRPEVIFLLMNEFWDWAKEKKVI
ncbi:MAG: hypothetical protein DRQ02_08290 [Candidatus Latescibacterota bacterium]|nr:MAG: hypothetical protein DRQ02_08290 [Candidatus Latescibacterota bacterium]